MHQRRSAIRSLVVLAGLTASLTVHALTPEPSSWREWWGKSYRLEADGNISCYSTDGINCHGAPRPANATVDKPVVCGAEHLKTWGTTGYDEAGHWCSAAYANLFAGWRNYGVLGHRVLLAFLPNGEPMCQSYDGRDCRWEDDSETPSKPGSIHPLVCGEAHRQVVGVTGHEDDSHWCNTPEILQRSPVKQLRVANSLGISISRGTVERRSDWRAGEWFAWIVRARMPQHLYLYIPIRLGGGVPPWYLENRPDGSLEIGAVSAWDTRTEARPAGISTSGWQPSNMRTFAFRFNSGSELRYYAAAGAGTDVLAPRNEVPFSANVRSKPSDPNDFAPPAGPKEFDVEVSDLTGAGLDATAELEAIAVRMPRRSQP